MSVLDNMHTIYARCPGCLGRVGLIIPQQGKLVVHCDKDHCDEVFLVEITGVELIHKVYTIKEAQPIPQQQRLGTYKPN